MGRAGIEPAMRSRRFYRPLPTPIGEPTQKVVQTGLEPANYTLERRAARPLRFCTKREISTTYKFEKLFLTASRFSLAEAVGVEPTSVL